jgi:hypothetical protein
MNNKNAYIQGYIKSHYKRISLNLSKTKDKDILEAIELEGQGNIQAGIKSLIRKALKA